MCANVYMYVLPLCIHIHICTCTMNIQVQVCTCTMNICLYKLYYKNNIYIPLLGQRIEVSKLCSFSCMFMNLNGCLNTQSKCLCSIIIISRSFEDSLLFEAMLISSILFVSLIRLHQSRNKQKCTCANYINTSRFSTALSWH